MKIILLQKPFTYVLFREVPRNSTFFGTKRTITYREQLDFKIFEFKN